MSDVQFEFLREQMVQQIAEHCAMAREHTGKAALDGRVMTTMKQVPRHEFVPVEMRPYAYLDSPLPIGHGKTISQPFIVALMTDLLEARAGDAVLEIGTGLGYQAAVLAQLAARVFSVEMIEELAQGAGEILSHLGYGNIETRHGNGIHGWAEYGPFDRIMVTAAPDLIPPMLLQQLKPGGRMVIPTGLPTSQMLILVEKDADSRIETRNILPVRFSTLESGEDG